MAEVACRLAVSRAELREPEIESAFDALLAGRYGDRSVRKSLADLIEWLARKAAAAPTMDDALEPEADTAGGRAARGEAGAQVPAPAQAAAAQMGALAYTVGEYIVLAPGGARSDDLLGHELAHVVQQRQGRVQI